nr:hypothetical protein [uncultured Ruminococcus sp.]
MITASSLFCAQTCHRALERTHHDAHEGIGRPYHEAADVAAGDAHDDDYRAEYSAKVGSCAYAVHRRTYNDRDQRKRDREGSKADKGGEYLQDDDDRRQDRKTGHPVDIALSCV